FVPMGFEFATHHLIDASKSNPEDFASAQQEAEFDLSAEIKAANALADLVDGLSVTGEMRQLTGPACPITALLKSDANDVRNAGRGLIVLINPADQPQVLPLPFAPLSPEAGAAFGHPQPLENSEASAPLAADEVRVLSVERSAPVASKTVRNGRALTEVTKAPRVIIDRIEPQVEGGPFAVKRVI